MFEELEIAEELKPEYTEVLRALMKLEKIGFFPLNGSGNITFHYDNQGKLVKVVPSPTISIQKTAT